LGNKALQVLKGNFYLYWTFNLYILDVLGPWGLEFSISSPYKHLVVAACPISPRGKSTWNNVDAGDQSVTSVRNIYYKLMAGSCIIVIKTMVK
jgi:hypothetical protein